MFAITIFVLWTWGLTPLWVNIVGTVICSLKITSNILEQFDD